MTLQLLTLSKNIKFHLLIFFLHIIPNSCYLIIHSFIPPKTESSPVMQLESTGALILGILLSNKKFGKDIKCVSLSSLINTIRIPTI